MPPDSGSVTVTAIDTTDIAGSFDVVVNAQPPKARSTRGGEDVVQGASFAKNHLDFIDSPKRRTPASQIAFVVGSTASRFPDSES